MFVCSIFFLLRAVPPICALFQSLEDLVDALDDPEGDPHSYQNSNRETAFLTKNLDSMQIGTPSGGVGGDASSVVSPAAAATKSSGFSFKFGSSKDKDKKAKAAAAGTGTGTGTHAFKHCFAVIHVEFYSIYCRCTYVCDVVFILGIFRTCDYILQLFLYVFITWHKFSKFSQKQLHQLRR